MPDRTVACLLDLADRKADVGRFQLLQANDARPSLLQPAQEPTGVIDAVDVEGGDFHRPAQLVIRSAQVETASAMVLRWSADENPEMLFRGFRSWLPFLKPQKFDACRQGRGRRLIRTLRCPKSDICEKYDAMNCRNGHFLPRNEA